MFREFYDRLVAILTPTTPVRPGLGPLDMPVEAKPKPNPYRLCPEALDLIKLSEGFFIKAYVCPAGVPTIGYGTIKYPMGRPVSIGDICNREQAEYYLIHEINLAKGRIVRFLEEIELELNPNQFGALVSFAYNLGAGVITNPDRSMSIALRAKDLDLVADTFLIYNKAGGKALTGLATRRNAERELFLKPVV